MKRALKILLLALGMAAYCASPFAVYDPVNDDTDLFRNNPNIPAQRPNVLIILDNTANWSSGGKFAAEKAALVTLVKGDGTVNNPGLDGSFNVGLMIMGQGGSCRFTTLSGSPAPDGGYVRFGIRQMIEPFRTALANVVDGFADASCNSIATGGDQGSSAVGGQAMHEAYLYFAGLNSRAGITQERRDYASNPNNTLAGTLAGNPLTGVSTIQYVSPITDGCQKNYIIFISNGPFDNGDNAPSATLFAGTGGLVPGAQPIALNPGGKQANWVDEYAGYLSGTGVRRTIGGVDFNPKVYTYAVEVDPDSTGQGPDHTALMRSMALQGKGKYFGVTAADAGSAILSALKSIFTEIQAVNSVFAASTLPVSVNVRGTNLNQLYIGVFRPDAADLPRWLGNLKAYQLKRDPNTGQVFTVDANGNAAINSSTGFITSTAKSFWTQPDLPNATYWSFRSAAENGAGGASDSPDGDLVEKGGAAQRVRSLYFANGVNGSPSRPVYTCTPGVNFATACIAGSLLSGTPFVVANGDIDQNSLNITSRAISSLSAAASKPVSALTDRRPVTLDNSDPSALTVASVTTTPATLSPAVTALDNTQVAAITAMSNGAAQKTVSVTKIGTGQSVKAQGTVTGGHGLQDGQTVAISGANAAFNTAGAVITYVNSTTFTYTLGTGNSTDSSGTLTTSSTTVTVTAANHGFSTGQTVTIANVTPTTFNGSGKTVTKVDDNTFTYQNVVDVAPTLASATATGASINVVASAAGHGLAVGRVFTLSGATPTSYNGTYTITATTSNTFTYQTPTAITTAATGPFTVMYSGTTATATITAGHLFANGANIAISGASPSGFNGSFTIFNATATTFDYTVPPGLGNATANPAIKASTGTTNLVTATLPRHGFVVGDQVTIGLAADSNHNNNFFVTLVVDANTFKYDTIAIFGAPGGTPNVRLTSNPRAYATIAGHGYGNAGDAVTVTISGASPDNGAGGYDQAPATGARVEDDDTISYQLTASQGGAATGTILASTNGLVATAVATAHGFNSGETVTIAGATVGAFNGAKVITRISADAFTYAVSPAQGAAVAATAAGITAAGQDERTNLINWVRGEDNYEDENHNGSFTDPRATLHGDVLHSRPAVVNYNRRTDAANVDNDVYIFYGGNDGLFRAVKGGFGSSTGDPAIGTEVWSFVAREHFGNLRRLRLDAPAISNALKKPYFFDGPIGVYTKDANGDGKLDVSGTPDPTDATQDKVWMFLTMRRGGRFIYALDVSQPLSPRLLWRKGCPSLETNAALKEANGCDLGWGELGYTFSEPKVVTLDPAVSADPALIFGAGYDPLVEDADPSTVNCNSGVVAGFVRTGGTAGDCTSGTKLDRSMGRGVFVVNARTGAIIWHASGQVRPASIPANSYLQVTDMNYAVSTDFSVVVGDPTVRPFRAYFGDNGGQMWRFDFGNADKTKWSMVKLASIADQTTFAGRRKFQFAADVIGASGFDMVVVGTGDREHPFDTTAQNRVYAFKDKQQTSSPVDAGGAQIQPTIVHATTVTFNGSSIKTLLDVSTQCIEIPGNCSGTAPEVAVISPALTASLNTSAALGASSNEGWFITLGTGEKQIGSTLAAGSGSVVFATNQPSTSAGGGACAPNLGVARQYAVNYLDGTAFNGTTLATTYAGGGFLPSPVLVYVGLGGATGTGTTSVSGVPVGGSVSGGTIGIGAGSSTGGSGNTATAVVCYGASCSLAPGSVLFSRLRKFWYKEID